jgi:hypothetical protein
MFLLFHLFMCNHTKTAAAGNAQCDYISLWVFFLLRIQEQFGDLVAASVSGLMA